jgi:hypothetical protein
VLVLTKPIGNQLALAVHEYLYLKDQRQFEEIKGRPPLEVPLFPFFGLMTHLGEITAEEIRHAYAIALASMKRLNRNAARLMHK